MKAQFRPYLALGLVLSCTAMIGAAHTEAPTPSYSTSVSIEPAGSGVFLLKAEVTDAAGEVLAGPSLKMPGDDTAETTSTLKDSTVVTLSATINDASRTASYSITLKKGERVLSRHSANVVL
jgi:hypothetical protein